MRCGSAGRRAAEAEAGVDSRRPPISTSVCRVAVLFAAIVACSGSAPTVPSEFQVRFVASNDLLAPVTFRIDGKPYVILTNGRSVGLALSSATHLTWTSAKPADADGNPIPDMIGEQEVSVSGINGVLEISNVIDNQTYITARMFNHTGARVRIGVYEGSTVSCGAALPAAAAGGFVQIGYYRLQANTEVRAYRDGSDCTGPYVAWTAPQLNAFDAKSGLVRLTLDVAP
jgi:hypothetical protein